MDGKFSPESNNVNEARGIGRTSPDPLSSLVRSGQETMLPVLCDVHYVTEKLGRGKKWQFGNLCVWVCGVLELMGKTWGRQMT